MKLNLIYYKNILDLALEKFMSGYGDFFSKYNGKYVLSLAISKDHLQKALGECVRESINDVAAKCCTKDDVLLVIGSCYPKDNLLLSFRDDSYFPKKLIDTIDQRPALKWVLAENDIDVDIDLFNEVLVSIFNKYFCKKEPKRSAMMRQHIVFAAHSKLDCYMMFKIVKWAYGSSNCCNVWKEELSSIRQNFIALNDLVSKYIHNKNRMNKSHDFKKYALEVKDYLDTKLGFCNE